FVGQRFGIRLFKSDVESLGGRPLPGFLEPVSGNVATIELCARPCRNQGGWPCTAADIKQSGSGCDAEPTEKLLRILFHIAGEKVVVSRHPCSLQTSLELVNIFGRLGLLPSRIHAGVSFHACLDPCFSRYIPNIRPAGS